MSCFQHRIKVSFEEVTEFFVLFQAVSCWDFCYSSLCLPAALASVTCCPWGGPPSKYREWFIAAFISRCTHPIACSASLNTAKTNARAVLSHVFSGLSTGCQQHSNVAVSSNTTLASLSQVQTLALNGLNMLSQSQTQASPGTKDRR